MATKLPAKKTTGELQIDYEVASEIIAEYFALVAKQLANEKRQPTPNPEKIKSFESQLLKLKHEKMNLSDEKVIHNAMYNYAPLLKNA
jgi:hypothetical protein